MIRKNGKYLVDVRKEMRGGEGEVMIEHLWSPQEELKAPTRLFARLTLKPGCSIGFHAHDNEEEVFYIVSGVAEADDNGSRSVLESGDTILTGGGAGHSIRNAGTGDLVIIAVISSYV